MKSKTRLTALVIAIAMLLLLGSSPAAAFDPTGGNNCSDGSGILSERTVRFLADRNEYLAANCSGAAIFVMTVRSLEGDTVENYATAVMRSRRIGDANEKNGVLLLLAIEDNEYIIVPGSGLRNILTPAVLTSVNAGSCQPYFETGDYDTAVLETVRKLSEYIIAGYGISSDGSQGVEGGCARISCSCREVGLFSLAACSACVAAELSGSFGGDR